MQRVVGIETEYGLLGRSAHRRMSSGEAAQVMFGPLEAEYRSSSAFLPNGGRLYLDVGSHPEYATPECLTAFDAVVAGRAGDDLMAALAARAELAAADSGTPVRLRLFKNNADSYGNSYGSHENYLVARSTDPERLTAALTSFLVTRQLFCGNGRLVRGSYLLSQRADHLKEAFAATTTRARPLVNSRDEPLADPARFRRLHVLAGDSNLSETSAWLRFASTEAVIGLAEEGVSFDHLALADPIAALPAVARNPQAPLERREGGSITAIEVQRGFAEAVAGQASPPPAPPGTRGLVGEWGRVLDALAGDDPDTVADTVEWAAKRRLLADYRDRHGLALDHPRLAAVNLAFHQLGSGGLFTALEDGGVVRRLSTPGEVEAARSMPPSGTRAGLRSRLITAARAAGADYTVDWTGFTVHDLPGADRAAALVLADPLATTSDSVDALVEALESARFAR